MEHKFYLKKLTKNELGYRNGKLSTGQMFYISKQAVDFFPPLKVEVTNDFVVLEILTDYLQSSAFVNLVWHNDKLNREQGTRDEYRIYLNQDIAPDVYFFRPDDIILFEKISEKKYTLKKFRKGDSEYEDMEWNILGSKNRGQHALLDKLLFKS